jgi:hypothetical protein
MVNTPEQQRNAENLQNNQTVEEIVIDTKKSVDSLSVEQRTKAETDALASFVNKNNRTENVDTTPEQQQLAQNIDDLLAKYQDLAK